MTSTTSKKSKKQTDEAAPGAASAGAPEKSPEAAPADASGAGSASEEAMFQDAAAAPETEAEDTPRDVEELISRAGLPAWKGAALLRQQNWAPGKQVGERVFSAALKALEYRRQGG